MQEVIPGRGEGQKMSRGWSVFTDEDRGRESSASPESCKQGRCSEAPGPKRLVCPSVAYRMRNGPSKAEIARSMC
jgi:hypothetical protein